MPLDVDEWSEKVNIGLLYFFSYLFCWALYILLLDRTCLLTLQLWALVGKANLCTWLFAVTVAHKNDSCYNTIMLLHLFRHLVFNIYDLCYLQIFLRYQWLNWKVWQIWSHALCNQDKLRKSTKVTFMKFNCQSKLDVYLDLLLYFVVISVGKL